MGTTSSQEPSSGLELWGNALQGKPNWQTEYIDGVAHTADVNLQVYDLFDAGKLIYFSNTPVPDDFTYTRPSTTTGIRTVMIDGVPHTVNLDLPVYEAHDGIGIIYFSNTPMPPNFTYLRPSNTNNAPIQKGTHSEAASKVTMKEDPGWDFKSIFFILLIIFIIVVSSYMVYQKVIKPKMYPNSV